MRRVVALLATLVLVSTLVPATVVAASPQTTWIVQLRTGVDPGAAAPALARQHGGTVGRIYRHALNGFSFRGPAAAATGLRANPQVTVVEADAAVWLGATQTGATWSLDRIDQRALPLSSTYTYDRTGAGVTAYVIDTGRTVRVASRSGDRLWLTGGTPALSREDRPPGCRAGGCSRSSTT